MAEPSTTHRLHQALSDYVGEQIERQVDQQLAVQARRDELPAVVIDPDLMTKILEIEKDPMIGQLITTRAATNTSVTVFYFERWTALEHMIEKAYDHRMATKTSARPDIQVTTDSRPRFVDVLVKNDTRIDDYTLLLAGSTVRLTILDNGDLQL